MTDINFNWDKEVLLGLPLVEKQLDIFFQPALSWSLKDTNSSIPPVSSTVGIALFFLENDPSPNRTDGQDFKQLAKGLITWAWMASNKTLSDEMARPQALPYLKRLYDQFLKTPFDHNKLIKFFSDNYIFRIHECTSEINGTIFPMFPQLKLTVGSSSFEVTSPNIKRKASKGGADIFSGQFLPIQITGSSSSTAAYTKTAKEFIFEDYGRLLMRSSLQMVMDHLEQKPGTIGDKITITTLLAEFDQLSSKTAIYKLAGMVSRFMLHGVRLDLNGGTTTSDIKPLYEATGQQFLLKKAEATNGYNFTIEDIEKESFLNFPPFNSTSTHSFTYILPLSENLTDGKSPLLALANSFESLVNPPAALTFDETLVIELPFYREEPRLFALRKWVKWQTPPNTTTATFLLQIPQSLQFFLLKRDPNPAISLFQIDPATRPKDLTAESLKIANTKYNWSTRINISITRIPKSQGSGFLPETFALSGISEAEINLLESILGNSALLANCKLHVLYASDKGTTAPSMASYPGLVDNFLLIRNNFSTNNPDADADIDTVEAKMKSDKTSLIKFLQLLWEGATVNNGGYFFHLPHTGNLPTALFDDGDSDQIYLLIEFDSQDKDPIHDFHNNVILNSSKALEDQLIIAKIEDGIDSNNELVNEKIPILNIPPGFFGFRYECVPPDKLPVTYPTVQVQASTFLRVEPNPSAAIIQGITISNDSKINALNLSLDKKSVLTEVNGNIGWVTNTQIKNAVKGETLFLRSNVVVFEKPEAKEKKETGKISANTSVKILEIKTERIEIESINLKGWVAKNTVFLETVLPALDLDINHKHAERELINLYQLLGYQIAQDTTVNKLPIGPTVDKSKPDMWQFERMVPAYKRFTPNTLILESPIDPANPPTTPDLEKNPYNGIKKGTDAQLDINYWWQDIYGNSLSKTATPKDFPVKYTDPIIGINKWPSVTESYHFVGSGAKNRQLVIELSFSTAAYQDLKPGGATARRLKADMETFTRIFYQLNQDDIDLYLTTSLQDEKNWKPTFKVGAADDPNSLLSFVLKIYQHLLKLYQFLEKLEKFKAANEAAINTAIQNEIEAIKPILNANIETEVKKQIQAAFEAKVIPEIIQELEQSTDNKLDYKTRLDERTAAELPAIITAELQKRRDTLLKNSIASLSKEKFDERLNTQFKAAHSGLTQATIKGLLKPANFMKNLDISSSSANSLDLKNDFIQGLDVHITIARADGNIHPNIPRNTKPGSTELLDPNYKDVHKSLAILSPTKPSSFPIPPGPLLSLKEIATEVAKKNPQLSITVKNIVEWNQNTSGIIKDGVVFLLKELIKSDDDDIMKVLDKNPPESDPKIISEYSDTFNILADRIKKSTIKELETAGIQKPTVNFSMIDLIEYFEVKENARGILKPHSEITVEAPNLRKFAENFTKAFPGYHLAVSEERNASDASKDRSQPGPEKFLFVVHLGDTGISYDFKETDPNIYAIPPLTTALFTGKVNIHNYNDFTGAPSVEKEVNALDMNVLARDFLAAFEDFLKPETLIPAFKLDEPLVISILQNKFQLAERISETVIPVLKEDNSNMVTDERLREAHRAIRHKLRLNLLEGYDVESIVQFQVKVSNNTGQAKSSLPPRLIGRAKVISVSLGEDPKNLQKADPKSPDYHISPGYFELSSDSTNTSSFTYLFDTKTPEQFGNIHLEMEFEPLEMEYNLIKNNSDFLASDKLRFILPENLNAFSNFPKPNYMGKNAIPIPLRNYPQPPSLIFQRAESDDSSLQNINDLREWEYKIVYEHQDIAQDSIDCIVRLNVLEEAFVKQIVPDFRSEAAAAATASAAATTANLEKENALAASAAVTQEKGKEKAARDLMKKSVSPTDEIKHLKNARAARASANALALLAKAAANKAAKAEAKAVKALKAVEAFGEDDPTLFLETEAFVEEAKTAAKEAHNFATAAAAAVDNLFDLLINFAEVHSDITTGLALSPQDSSIFKDTSKAQTALTALEYLSSQIADNWSSVEVYDDTASHYVPEAGDLHYEISEEPLPNQVIEGKSVEKRQAIVTLNNTFPGRDGVKPLVPLLDLPGFSRTLPPSNDTPVHRNPETFIYTEGNLTDGKEKTFAFDPHDYGDSSIPDRVFRIENLDVLEYQNAAASIWLSRNKNLVFNKETNEAFVFRTPAVSFANPAFPYITNDEPFDIAMISDAKEPPVTEPQDHRTLQDHMDKLMNLLKPMATVPTRDDYRYEARLSCRFAFSLAKGKGLNDDLVSTLPVLIGLRLSPSDSVKNDGSSQILKDYPGKLRAEISSWFKKHQPVEDNAYLLFSLDIFSRLDVNENSSLPMLRVKQLKLMLTHIHDMADVR